MKERIFLTIVLLGFFFVQSLSAKEDPWKKYSKTLPPGNIRITASTFEVDRHEESVFQEAFQFRDGGIQVQGGEVLATNGMVVFGAAKNFAGAFRAKATHRKTLSENKAMIITMNDSPARISATESRLIPVNRLVIWGLGTAIVRTFDVLVTGTSLEATPHVLENNGGDGMIEVQLVPVVSYVENNQTLTVRVDELRTTVRIPEGREIVIASQNQRQDSLASSFFTQRAASGERKVLMVLRVDLK